MGHQQRPWALGAVVTGARESCEMRAAWAPRVRVARGLRSKLGHVFKISIVIHVCVQCASRSNRGAQVKFRPDVEA